MIWQEQFWNYRQFGTIVGRLRDYLGEMHLQSDDVVPVMVGNRLEMLAAHCSALNWSYTKLDHHPLGSIKCELDSETCGEQTPVM